MRLRARLRLIAAAVVAVIMVSWRRIFFGPLQSSWTFKFEVLMQILNFDRKKNITEKNVRDNIVASRIKSNNGIKQINPLPKNAVVTPLNLRPQRTWDADWITLKPETNYQNKRVIFYCHGGAYVVLTREGYRGFITKIMKYSDSIAFNVDYRLAPENKFPCAVEDAVDAYLWLIDSKGGNINPKNIVFMGDSAGGGLGIATMIWLNRNSKPLPACYVGLSPWVDLTQSMDSWERHDPFDYIYKTDLNLATLYANQEQLKDPLVSPLYATKSDLQNLPPMLIQCGSCETLHDENVEFAEHAKRHGVNTKIEIFESMPHVFHIFSYFQPHHAKQAFQQIADFVSKHAPVVESSNNFNHSNISKL